MPDVDSSAGDRPNGIDGNIATRTPPCCSPRSLAVWCVGERACVASQHAGAEPQCALSSCVCASSNDNDIPVEESD